ncbi:MAG: tetratricopeptide repeat protein [Acidobacteria bacterium]|nr:tetratricopeptide repeat protein [Acidobacteriota bacterium]MDA1234496.1 tetratricopeptide repeat protein [Acidobacteriota bacterium]
MTCTTCHDPHNVASGEAARTRFTNVCKTCHADDALARIPDHAAATDCRTCHMPKRRTDDAVHVVMTDHYIQRRPPPGDLLATLEEIGGSLVYRGPVEPYYPANLGSNPTDELYLALAQVSQRANVEVGTPRLRELIERYQPAESNFYFQLAEVYRQQEQFDAALPWYEQTISRDPTHLVALRNYASVLSADGQYAKAEEIIRRALEIAPDDPKAMNSLGEVLVVLGRSNAAIPILNRALAIDPDSPEALQNLARAFRETGDRARGIEAARRAIRVVPEFAAARNTLATLLGDEGQLVEAEREFLRALELDPDDAVARYNYAGLLADTKRFEESERYVREAVRLAPTMASAHRSLGKLLALRGATGEAESSFRKALEIEPNDSETHFNLGNALATLRRLPEAAERFRRSVQLRPRYDQARMNLAIVLASMGDEAGARAEVAHIVDPALRQRAEQILNGGR